MADVLPSTDVCGLPSNPAVPAGHMLADPAIPAAPPDIPDALPVPVVPLAGLPPCPTIRAAPGSAITVTPGDCCDFLLDVDLPTLFCPTVTTNPAVVTQKPADAADPAAAVVFQVNKAEDGCAFDFDLAISFPCPVVEVGTVGATQKPADAVDPTGSVSLTVAPSGEGCAFELELAVAFPCPTVAVGTATIEAATAPGDPGSVDLTITPSGDGCAFTIDLAIVVPAASSGCPEFTVNEATVTQLSGGSPPTAELKISDAGGCKFDVDLDIGFPCLTVNTPTASIEVLGDGEPASVSLTAGTGKSGCALDLGLKIGLPNGGYACPEFNAPTGTLASLPPGTPPSGSFTITNAGGCKFDVDLDIGFPCTGMAVGAVDVSQLDPGGGGTVDVVLTPSLTECAYDLSVAVGFPCVDIADASVEVLWGKMGEAPTASLLPTYKGGCVYNPHLEIQFPCPNLTASAKYINVVQNTPGLGGDFLPTFHEEADCTIYVGANITFPCPEITVAAAEVNIVDETEPEATLFLGVTPSEIDCSFSLDFELGLPIGDPVTFDFLQGPITVECNDDGTFTVHATEKRFSGRGTVTDPDSLIG